MSTERNKELQIKMLAKAWSDPNFKEELLRDPTGVCRREGMEFEGEMRVSATIASANDFYLPPGPLPPEKPNELASDPIPIIHYEKKASEIIAADKEMF